MNIQTILTLALLLVLTVVGCRTEGEPFAIETSLVTDAVEGYGPYEVTVRTSGVRAIDRVNLHWVTPSGGTYVLPMSETTPGVWVNSIRGERRNTEEGIALPPFVHGSRIRYWIEVQPAADGDDVVTDPLEAPQETFSFIVGPPRLPIRIDGVSPNTGPSSGGTPVFIHGAGFRPDSTVVFATSVAD
ncbi:MAG: IPT/TIG domain-containing protein, partial [Myxococcota bacterium]